LFERALAFRRANTFDPKDYEELKAIVEKGWAFSWWCGDTECEMKVKDETKATTRCIPLEQEGGRGNCIVCGKPATEKAIFGRAY
jgi:prolyl-tRNA synthetase